MVGGDVRRQGGVVLIIALIVLVAMTLAGIALVRSVDTATLISGNLTFRQATTLYADKGIGAAVSWLRGNSAATLAADQGTYYFASSRGGLPVGTYFFDPTRFDWSSHSSAPIKDAKGGGYEVVYVIHRMCDSVGPADTPGLCFLGPGSQASPDMTIASPLCPGGVCPPVPVPLYRITTRAVGPRNIVSYTQAVVY